MRERHLLSLAVLIAVVTACPASARSPDGGTADGRLEDARDADAAPAPDSAPLSDARPDAKTGCAALCPTTPLEPDTDCQLVCPGESLSVCDACPMAMLVCGPGDFICHFAPSCSSICDENAGDALICTSSNNCRCRSPSGDEHTC